MRILAAVTIGAVLLVVGVGCSATSSNEVIEAELAAVTAERDALSDTIARQQQRHDMALATLDGINAMLEDPDSFGSDEEIVDLIAQHATEGAFMDDEVFGAVPYRQGFYNTLYGGEMNTRIDVTDSWVSADGSQGGALWIWYGTNAAGHPFELAGLSRDEFDEDGRITYELVTYPYPDAYVTEAVLGAGTPTPATGVTR